MKKYLLNFLLILTTLSLAACGSNSENAEGNTSSNGGAESNTSETLETPKENAAEVEEPKTLTINLGETLIAEDFAEVTVQSNKFGKVVNPPSPGSFYSYYEVKEKGEIYLDTVITVKSLLTSQRTSDEFVDVKIVYDDKYEYTTFSTIEDEGGADFTYTNITSIEPLKTGTLHFLAEVPESIETDGKPLKAIITMDGEEYEQIIR